MFQGANYHHAMNQFSLKNTYKKTAAAGFTLIELLVVLVVVSVITFLLLVQQSKFDSSTVLRSLAYNVALSVRQAQVYGVSVRESALGSATFAQAYGLYVDPVGNPQNYTLFADTNNNQRYDAAPSPGEGTMLFKVNKAYRVSEVCVIRGDGLRRCSGGDDTSGAGTINTLTVLFRRPNPDAIFFGLTGAGGLLDTPDQYTSAYIQLQATDGTKRGVHVYVTGQVSVDALGQAI